MQTDLDEMIMRLGFTRLESQIYLYLLANGPDTGYAIAKGIDKAVANVYKGVEALAHKGAIEQASGNSKLCNAVPWRQLLDSEKKKYDDNLRTLSQSLKNLPRPKYDEEIYHIKNANRLKEHALSMIESARSIILADIEPAMVSFLNEALIKAAERGVEVRVKLYEETEMHGVNTVIRENGKAVYAKTQDVQLSISTDGNEMLKALLNSDCSRVIQAFHSRSALMALMLYNQLLYELVLTDLKRVIPEGDIESAKKILRNTEHLHPFSSENTTFDNFKENYKIHRE